MFLYALALSAVFFSLFYIYIISRYQREWDQLSSWKIPFNFYPSTKVSILIPARNEASNIEPCLNPVCRQKYPRELFEVILIDDHSTDATAEIAKQLNHPNLTILDLAEIVKNEKGLQSFKKKAIEEGIKKSTGQLIVTTDADCIVDPDWLNYLVSFYENNDLKFIAAPVNFYQESNLLERFQSLDFLGMMCVTGAGIQGRFMNMCNGANLAYEKKVFDEVGGFHGIDQLASGDDMLLMQKIAKVYPDQIGYLKNSNARTLTKAQPTLNAFLQQRIRWTTKSRSYPEWKVTFILTMVFFFCVSIVLSLVLIPFYGWPMFLIFIGQLFVKGIMDYFFLGKMARFFNRTDLMSVFIPALLMHIVYIVVVGTLGNLKQTYEWKGRRVK